MYCQLRGSQCHSNASAHVHSVRGSACSAQRTFTTGQDVTPHCNRCAIFTQFYSRVKKGIGLLHELSTVTQPIDVQAAPSLLAEWAICWLVKFILVGLEKSAPPCFICCAASRARCPPSRWRSGSVSVRRWSLCTLPLLNSPGRWPTKRAKYL